MNNLSNELLKTLSYFEPMSIEYIYLDLSKEFTLLNPELNVEDLLKCLTQLEKEKKIKSFRKEKQKYWQRVYPKKSLWHRFYNFFRR